MKVSPADLKVSRFIILDSAVVVLVVEVVVGAAVVVVVVVVGVVVLVVVFPVEFVLGAEVGKGVRVISMDSGTNETLKVLFVMASFKVCCTSSFFGRFSKVVVLLNSNPTSASVLLAIRVKRAGEARAEEGGPRLNAMTKLKRKRAPNFSL